MSSPHGRYYRDANASRPSAALRFYDVFRGVELVPTRLTPSSTTTPGNPASPGAAALEVEVLWPADFS